MKAGRIGAGHTGIGPDHSERVRFDMAGHKVGAIAPSVITREQAKALGLTTYFTGTPCRHGHIAPRMVGASNECLTCKAARDKSYAATRKAQKAEYDRTYRAANQERGSANRKRWVRKNRAYYLADQRRRYAEDRDKHRAYREANRARRAGQCSEWREANKDRVRSYSLDYQSRRMAEDLNYKIAARLRARLATAVRDGDRGGSAVRNLGCSIEQLKAHLEDKFRSGMSWDTWGRRGWHIDHIRPLVSFDLTDPAQVRAACHYTNLQPLWYSENCAKAARTNWKRTA